MLALLAARPFRIKNFSSIEIGQHLISRGNRYDLRFEPAETKTHTRLEVEFLASLVHHINFMKLLMFIGPLPQ